MWITSICSSRWSSIYGSIGNPAPWTPTAPRRPNRRAAHDAGHLFWPARRTRCRWYAGAARLGISRLPALVRTPGRQLDRGRRREAAQESQQATGQGKSGGCRQTEAAFGEAMMRKFVFALFAALLFTAAAAQQPATPPIEWAQLTDEQRALLDNMKAEWQSIPAERRAQLVEGARRWGSMSEEQRAEVRQRFALWQTLSKERREELRQRYEQFRALSREEQVRIRETQQRVR